MTIIKITMFFSQNESMTHAIFIKKHNISSEFSIELICLKSTAAISCIEKKMHSLRKHQKYVLTYLLIVCCIFSCCHFFARKSFVHTALLQMLRRKYFNNMPRDSQGTSKGQICRLEFTIKFSPFSNRVQCPS